MGVTIDNFISSGSPNWHWPVRIGLFNGTVEFLNALKKYYWSQRLSEIEIVDSPTRLWRKQFDILLVPNPRDLDLLLQTPFDGLPPSCIIVLGEPYLIRSFGLNYSRQFRRLFEKYPGPPLGFFAVAPRFDVSQWFENVIVEMSHNKNIITALQQHATDGHLYFDPILERTSTISYAVERVIDRLKIEDQTFQFNSPLLGKNKLISSEVVEVLRNLLINAKFEHESDEASKVAEVTKIIYQYDRDLFDPLLRTLDAEHFDDLLMEMKMSDSPKYTHSAKMDSASDPAQQPDDRFLQAQIIDSKKQSVQKLKPATDYTLRIKIDHDPNWSSGDLSFPSDVVFENSISREEKILILFKTGPEDKPHFQQLTLPRYGASTAVNFKIKSGRENEFEGEVYAYHKNRLIQKAVITCPIEKKAVDSVTGIIVKVVFSAVQDLANLGLREQFTASFYYEPKNSPGQIQGIVNNKPIDLYLLTDGLEKIIKKIKSDIEDAVVSVGEAADKLRTPKNIDLLRTLALRGNMLLVNHLGKKNKFDGPVQIVSKRTGFVPLDFVYDLPPPAQDAKLCDHAESALRSGKCAGCFDHSKSPAPFVCPFGFWSFSRVVERHSSEYEDPAGNGAGDYRILSASDSRQGTLQILNDTVHASTQRIDSVVAGTRENLRKAIQQNCTTCREAEDWDKWDLLTKDKKPDSLILVVHLEPDEATEIDQLEIGDGKLLLQNFFDETKLGTSPPFVIIIGCEVINTATYGFDISNQLMRHGAAIVLSNFTRITGRQAGPIVVRLVELLRENQGNTLTFGQVLLKLRQRLLADGYIASLTLIAHGDADWKIKI
jgi:hypothetical protein